MKLTASLIVHNEMGRYLESCLESLRSFCDEVRIYDDGSTDALSSWRSFDNVMIKRSGERTFFDHEGKARQAALNWALEGDPTHILSIDADEFVSDGVQLRRAIERSPAQVMSLCMKEIWMADPEGLWVRQDGGWAEHEVGICYLVDRARLNEDVWKIPNKALACGRVPEIVRRRGRARCSDVDILHFGWANQAEREARHHRYVVADGGKFHAGSHLDSIMWTDGRVKLERRPWPVWLEPQRPTILEHVQEGLVPA